MAVPTKPALDAGAPAPAASGGTSSAPQTTAMATTGDYMPWIIGGAAVIGASAIGYAVWKKKHRGSRRRYR